MPSTSSDNDTSGKGPLLILWRSFQDVLSRRFSSGKHEKRDRFLLLFLTAGLITYLILPDQSFLAVRYRVGEVATDPGRDAPLLVLSLDDLAGVGDADIARLGESIRTRLDRTSAQTELAASRLDDQIDEALEKLAHEDPQCAELVKLRFFGGLSYEEAAAGLAGIK